MKKAILSLLIALPLCQASAQYRTEFSPVQNPTYVPVVPHRGQYVPTPLVTEPIAAKGAANPTNRWYNHAQSLASLYGLTQTQLYSDKYTTNLIIWQDSSVRYTGTSSNLGITWLSAAEVFAPNTQLYNSNTTTPVNNRGKISLKSESYRLDSVMVRGYYGRISGASGYNDTLILTFVSDSTLGSYSWYSYGGSVLADHGIDSFAAILWDGDAYQTAPINQISYQTTPSGGGPTKYLRYRGQIKVPLTQATFLDSLSDGSHLIKVPVGINVPGSTSMTGGRVSMSVTFKSGTTYTSGSPVTNYNYFALMSHETDSGRFQQYPLTDHNMSYMVSKDSVNTYVGNGLNFYIPTIGFTSPNYGAEIHDISWKVTCTTCAGVSVNDAENVMLGSAYPNPATDMIKVPFSVKTAANVTVSVSNMLGQTLRTQSFNMGAGQSKVATFSTDGLANGVYIYTVESDGNRVANRVTVTH